MKQKLQYLLLTFFTSLSITAQVANPPGNLEICDDSSNDGIAEFDLTILDPQVLGSQNPADFTVTYHETQADADNGTNALIMPYTNTSNPQLIYIRLTENSSGNFDITFVTISVASTPVAVVPSPLITCDLDGDGFDVFNLDDKTPEIIGGQADLEVTYHETLVDAEINVNTLTSPYANIVPYMQTVYARVANFTGSCATVVALDLIADIGPDHEAPIDYVICENDGDGTETIVVIDMINAIFSITNPDLTLNLYETLEDAQSMQNPIFDTYTTLSNPQTLYYALADNTTGCIAYGTFSIAIINCDDDADTDTVANGNEDVNGDGNFADDDTDMDGTPNYLDNDDDNDGVLTQDEDYNDNGDPTDDDTNGNNIPDYLDADVALSVHEVVLNTFTLYPNPAKTILNIELAQIESVNYTIYNIKGQRVMANSLKVDTKQIDISNLKSGLYFIKISSGSIETTKKLIIE